MATQPKQEIVFLLDVDDTLLDNDKVKADIAARLEEMLPPEGTQLFWQIYEEVRKELSVVNYPETLKRFAERWPDKAAAQQIADMINNWPYREYVYPGAIESIRHMESMGNAAILSDGDLLYQPHKIVSAGLADLVGPDDVLIYTHKEQCFADVRHRLPADHYVLVDDKEEILARSKELFGNDMTTVWVKQGHYANDPTRYRKPDPDIVLDRIGDIVKLSKGQFLGQ
jgi:FMN phosphatase YigB (HAD superfamily)